MNSPTTFASLSQAILGADVVVTALPVAHFRLVMGMTTTEPRLFTTASALLISFSSFSLFRDRQGSWLSLLAVLAAQCASLLIARRGLRVVALLVALAALCFAAPSIGLVASSEQALLAAVLVLSVAVLCAVLPALSYFAPRPTTAAVIVAAAGTVASTPAARQKLGKAVIATASLLLPIEEFGLAHGTALRFIDEGAFERRLATLGLVTVHTQLALGALGVTYLRSAQLRKNSLLAVGVPQAAAAIAGEGAAVRLPAASFTRTVGAFMLRTALPYMLQRTFFESVNSLEKRHFLSFCENELVIGLVLSSGDSLSAAAASNHTVRAQADALIDIMETPYGLIERKLFSLPKLSLLPGVLASQPLLTLLGLPLAVVVDGGKSWVSAKLTEKAEEHRRKAKALESKMAKVEAHDLAHASQIASGGAEGLSLARERWRELVEQVQREHTSRMVVRGLSRWLHWLYWQDVLQPGIEVGVAWLLEAGHIGLADVWLYARVVEDAVDFLLMRSRAEAELATITSDAKRLIELDEAVRRALAGERVGCRVGAPVDGEDREVGGVSVSARCEYARGGARVRVEPLTLPPAVYALSGPNGSGKSTLLSVLSSCARGGELLPGISLFGACEVELLGAPPTAIVEVHQRPYCPLQCAPIRWLARGLDGEPEALAARAAAIAVELRFSTSASANGHEDGDGNGADGGGSDAALAASLLQEAEDFCGGLSGGQRAKLELIRSVFLQPSCPSLLLLDEPFAALDAPSKSIIMRKLRAFCPHSVLVVVYHPDHESEASESVAAVCNAGGRGGFFDAVIEVRDGLLEKPTLCVSARSAVERPHSPVLQ
jgi:ABC-type uncharacterized transport system YnjBCD ATPase subunit